MEVGFDSFAGVVDAVGGIEVEVAHPAFDEHSGLLIETPGTVTLDGDQALAYVRSRHYTEVIDGRKSRTPPPTSVASNASRCSSSTALAEVGSTRNPVTLLRSASCHVERSHHRRRDGLHSTWSGWPGRERDSAPRRWSFRRRPARKGGAAVLVLAQPEADEVLATFAS